MRRGWEAQQFDLAYTAASLAFEIPEYHRGVRAGDLPPDVPLTGASQPVRIS